MYTNYSFDEGFVQAKSERNTSPKYCSGALTSLTLPPTASVRGCVSLPPPHQKKIEGAAVICSIMTFLHEMRINIYLPHV